MPPQQGYYPPPQPPKQRSKAPVVIAVVVGSILLLGALGTGGFFFFNVRKDQGSPPRTVTQPEFCRNVSAETLKKVRTTNPAQRGNYEQKFDNSTLTSCAWEQTAGRDGSGMRMLTVYTEQTDGLGEKAFDLRVQKAESNAKTKTKKVDGVGDKASVVVVSRSGGHQELNYIVRKGDDVVSVEYIGWDPGLFTRGAPDTDEQEATAKAVIEEVLGKL